MKAGIITFNRAYNNGAVLQCYALLYALKKNGIDCQVVDYYPAYFEELYKIKKRFKMTHPPVKTWLNHFKLRHVLHERNKNYEDFIDRYIDKTDTFYSIEDIEDCCPDFDIFISGSDQVWNYGCTYFDPVYFLDFKRAELAKKYSYAACIGLLENQIPHNLLEEYKKRLTGYEEYSVREVSAVPIIKKLVGRTARIDVDPTLLLDGDEWDLICDKGIEEKSYIFVYYVQRTKKLQKYALDLAKSYKSKGKDIKVICVACNTEPEILSGKYDKEFCFDLRPGAGPSQVVRLIRDAECVITNSFHGSIFSILYHKKFVTLLTEDSGKINTRTSNLLNTLDLTERSMTEDFTEIERPIDWSSVENKLNAMRKNSLEYLKQIKDENS